MPHGHFSAQASDVLAKQIVNHHSIMRLQSCLGLIETRSGVSAVCAQWHRHAEEQLFAALILQIEHVLPGNGTETWWLAWSISALAGWVQPARG